MQRSTGIANITTGSVVTQAPQGPGAASKKTLANGYNDTYAAYYLAAGGNAAAFTFTPAAARPVTNPIFVIQNYAGIKLPRIAVDGSALSVNTGAGDAGAFVSVNQSAGELWVTLNRTLTAATSISIAP